MIRTFRENLILLDFVLTGKLPEGYKDESQYTPEYFIDGGIFYLSDGGYSRVYFTGLTGLAIDSMSSPKVKAAWHLASHGSTLYSLIMQLEKEIKEAEAAQ